MKVTANPASLSWQEEWGHSLRTAEDLAAWGLIEERDCALYEPVLKKYRFCLPRYYARLIDSNDRRCPIRLQALPSLEELTPEPSGFRADPLGDLDHRPEARITHRYPNRALLHLTPNCSMYCRYCFRKSLLNELASELFDGDVAPALTYLASHREIEEVIFSGGDPLMASDTALRMVLTRLNSIPHLRRYRIHTRVPVTFPQRITGELIGALSSGSRPLAIVTHFNHPKEVTKEATRALKQLSSVATLLNQSVLLSGVNDSAETLVELCTELYDRGVLPYYLHHPDRASGTAQFAISRERGLALERELRSSLPGYLVPRYVVDLSDRSYKVPVSDLSRRRRRVIRSLESS